MGRPFSFLCVSVIIGIVIGFMFNIYITGSLFISLLLILLFLVLFTKKYSNIYICIAFIVLGNFIAYYNIKDHTILTLYNDENMALQGVIKKISKEHERYEEYDIQMEYLITPKISIKIDEKSKLQIINSQLLDVNLEPGDKLTLKNIELVEDFNKEDLNGYEYYLRGQGFKSILKIKAKDIDKINHDNWNLRKSSYKTKKYIENFLDDSLQERNSNILKSIIFGNQGYLDRDILSLFSITGTAHIIAVSGLHVGVLVLILDMVLKSIGVGRNKKLILTMIILFFYAYMVDFPVSIIRAICMYYLYIGGYFFERRYDGINSLMMMAFIILLFNPFAIFSISFQLSFVATLSILLLYPIIKDYLSILPRFLQPLLGVTLAAQLGTIPIMAYHFNQISLISPIANIIIVPTLTPLLFLCFLSIVASLIFEGLGYIINYITNGLLTYIYLMIEKTSTWNYANIEIININYTYIFIYYFLLIIIYILLWKKKHIKPALEKE
mgnify:CR=1 FL=1